MQGLQRGIVGAAVPTLTREADDAERVLAAVAELYAAGAISTAAVPGSPQIGPPHLDMPRYPWQRTFLRTEDPATLLDRFGTAEGFAMLGDPVQAG